MIYSTYKREKATTTELQNFVLNDECERVSLELMEINVSKGVRFNSMFNFHLPRKLLVRFTV